jgi:hypothetical protein
MRYSDLAEEALPRQFEFSERHSRAAAGASVVSDAFHSGVRLIAEKPRS